MKVEDMISMYGMRHFNDSDVDSVLDKMIALGWDVRVFAHKFEMHQQGVRRMFKRHAINPKRNPMGLLTVAVMKKGFESIREFIDANGKMSYDEMARQLGISDASIGDAMRQWMELYKSDRGKELGLR